MKKGDEASTTSILADRALLVKMLLNRVMHLIKILNTFLIYLFFYFFSFLSFFFFFHFLIIFFII